MLKGACRSPGAREEMNIDDLILSIEEKNRKNMGREKPVKAGPNPADGGGWGRQGSLLAPPGPGTPRAGPADGGTFGGTRSGINPASCPAVGGIGDGIIDTRAM